MADGPVRQVLSDGALLRAAGLDVPQPVALLHALQKAGWAVRADRLLPEEAAGEIARAWKQRSGEPRPRSSSEILRVPREPEEDTP